MMAQELRDARLRLGLTQAELARILGMPQPALARLESGGRRITKIHAAFIRHLLECGQVGGGRPENTKRPDAGRRTTMKICDVETNKRINSFIRDLHPEDWDDVEWKVFRRTKSEEYWYIPIEDDAPMYDNVIEGHTGTLMYLDRDDAYDQWGEED